MSDTFQPGDRVTCNGNTQARIIERYHGTMYNVRLWHNLRHVGDVCVCEGDLLLENDPRKVEIRRLCDAKAVIKARLIGASSWTDHNIPSEVLTEAEKEEVKALWRTMPGNTCWNDAFREWMRQ